MAALVIRLAGDADFDACAAIFLESRAAAFPQEPPDTRDAAAFQASTAEEEVSVALLSGSMIALISVYWAENFIHSLYVHPDFQRRGAGRALLAHIQARAAFLELKVGTGNEAALGFYRRLGWREIGAGEGEHGPWLRLRWDRSEGGVPMPPGSST
jgi:ribosomal protein S18 acetylase RimI-like enzyme